MGDMSIKARKTRAAYMREWRKKHPDKEREYKARYWERIAEQKEAAKLAATEQGAKV